MRAARRPRRGPYLPDVTPSHRSSASPAARTATGWRSTCGCDAPCSPGGRRVSAPMPPPTSSGVFSCPAATCATTNSSPTVMSLYPYYAMRADLERAERLVESVRVQPHRQTRVVPAGQRLRIRNVAWYRGEFDFARTNSSRSRHAQRGRRTGARRNACSCRTNQLRGSTPTWRWRGASTAIWRPPRRSSTGRNNVANSCRSPRARSAWPTHGRSR